MGEQRAVGVGSGMVQLGWAQGWCCSVGSASHSSSAPLCLPGSAVSHCQHCCPRPGMGWDGMLCTPLLLSPPRVGLRAAQTNPGTSGGAVKLHSVPTAARVSVNALMSSAVVSCFFLLLSEVAAGRGWCLQLSLYGMLLSASAFVPCGAGGAAQSRRNAAHSASRASGRALIRRGGLCGSALQGAEL